MRMHRMTVCMTHQLTLRCFSTRSLTVACSCSPRCPFDFASSISLSTAHRRRLGCRLFHGHQLAISCRCERTSWCISTATTSSRGIPSFLRTSFHEPVYCCLSVQLQLHRHDNNNELRRANLNCAFTLRGLIMTTVLAVMGCHLR